MKKVVNFIFTVGNMFWIPFVCWKIYGWFNGEVGFELPELTYWNMFAIRLLLGLFNNNLGLSLTLEEKPDKKEESGTKGLRSVVIFGVFAIILLIDYLTKILLF